MARKPRNTIPPQKSAKPAVVKSVLVVGADEPTRERLARFSNPRIAVEFVDEVAGNQTIPERIAGVIVVVEPKLKAVLKAANTVSAFRAFNSAINVAMLPVGKSRKMSSPQVLQAVTGATVLDSAKDDKDLEKDIRSLVGTKR